MPEATLHRAHSLGPGGRPARAQSRSYNLRGRGTCKVRIACAWLQVQLRRGTWASPMVLGKAYDIRRMTAEQQAARAALQSLGLQVSLLACHTCACTGSDSGPGACSGLTLICLASSGAGPSFGAQDLHVLRLRVMHPGMHSIQWTFRRSDERPLILASVFAGLS